ncbi:hypothetical protein CICLE_v10017288mg [Citrus x clementina]|uniref:Uncharacterized protein n=1 Tax=Citrus clementina TaxID=85681 RepID=V4W309_CITCL|nr:hypothetical protein CICLE_v10017288mg [Citrus x clementina]
MSPKNKFDRRRKIHRDVLFPSHVGMLPESLLYPRSRVRMVVQFCKVEGISPDRRLLLSIKNLRYRREPMELGISLDKLLFDTQGIWGPIDMISASCIEV